MQNLKITRGVRGFLGRLSADGGGVGNVDEEGWEGGMGMNGI